MTKYSEPGPCDYHGFYEPDQSCPYCYEEWFNEELIENQKEACKYFQKGSVKEVYETYGVLNNPMNKEVIYFNLDNFIQASDKPIIGLEVYFSPDYSEVDGNLWSSKVVERV